MSMCVNVGVTDQSGIVWSSLLCAPLNSHPGLGPYLWCIFMHVIFDYFIRQKALVIVTVLSAELVFLTSDKSIFYLFIH